MPSSWDLDPIHRVSLSTCRQLERLIDNEALVNETDLGAMTAALDFLVLQADAIVESGAMDPTLPLPGDLPSAVRRSPAPAEQEPVTPPLETFRLEITAEIMEAYVDEAEEYLEEAETSLLGLEKDLGDSALLG